MYNKKLPNKILFEYDSDLYPTFDEQNICTVI